MTPGTLTDVAIRNAKGREKRYRLFAGGGLYLEVDPAGGKWWRLKYRFAGKEKRFSLGVYPEVSLKAAREKRDQARSLLTQGIDPGEHRRIQRTRTEAASADSFEAIALEWLAKFSPSWSEGHGDKIKRRLERDIFPWIGARAASSIAASELLTVLRRIENRGAIETAHRAHQNCGQVFRYAIATGRADRDPSADLRGALPPVKQEHHASITDPAAVGELLRAIAGYQGSFVTQCALRLAPLVFVRPGELRRAEWAEFDLEKAEWRIPAEKMKARELHIVPLSAQAIAVLRELQPLTSSGQFVFPGVRTNRRPMSENTVLAALRRLGYRTDQMTGHGFRSMASTLLHEQGWNRDAIERQLAHAERNKVRAAYNYAEHLGERRKMMQAWADYLDTLRDGRKPAALVIAQRNAAQQINTADQDRDVDRGNKDGGASPAPAIRDEIQPPAHGLRASQTAHEDPILSPDATLELEREEYVRQERAITADWKKKVDAAPQDSSAEARGLRLAITDERDKKLAELKNNWTEKHGSLSPGPTSSPEDCKKFEERFRRTMHGFGENRQIFDPLPPRISTPKVKPNLSVDKGTGLPAQVQDVGSNVRGGEGSESFEDRFRRTMKGFGEKRPIDSDSANSRKPG